jgi:hypothetical protein
MELLGRILQALKLPLHDHLPCLRLLLVGGLRWVHTAKLCLEGARQGSERKQRQKATTSDRVHIAAEDTGTPKSSQRSFYEVTER